MLAIVLLGFGAEELMRARIEAPGTVVAGKPPTVLLDRARDLVRDLGHGETPVGEVAYGLSYDPRHRAYWSDPSGPRDWQEELGAPVYFWYRQRPRPPTLDPFGNMGRQEGPLGPAAGTVRLRLDLDGHLRRFEAVPERAVRAWGPWAQAPDPGDSARVPHPSDPARAPHRGDELWDDLFALADLDPALFEAFDPSWPPPVYAHRRRGRRASPHPAPLGAGDPGGSADVDRGPEAAAVGRERPHKQERGLTALTRRRTTVGPREPVLAGHADHPSSGCDTEA